MPKPCVFVGSAKRDLASFPDDVRAEIGHALYEAQCGEESLATKALKGFGGRGVLEIVEDFDGNTYRAVYTVKFAETIYVLHAFQKKSKKGTKTPRSEIDLIRKRLKDADEHHRARQPKDQGHAES